MWISPISLPPPKRSLGGGSEIGTSLTSQLGEAENVETWSIKKLFCSNFRFFELNLGELPCISLNGGAGEMRQDLFAQQPNATLSNQPMRRAKFYPRAAPCD